MSSADSHLTQFPQHWVTERLTRLRVDWQVDKFLARLWKEIPQAISINGKDVFTAKACCCYGYHYPDCPYKAASKPQTQPICRAVNVQEILDNCQLVKNKNCLGFQCKMI